MFRNKFFLVIFLYAFLSHSVKAQELKNLQFELSHPLKFGNENSYLTPRFDVSQTDSINVVAILVQFQEDDNSFTTGNGKFDLSDKYYNATLQRDTVIDSPPYDSAYFADHLKFLINYWDKASDGKLKVKFDLLGQVITLPKKMEEYSPRDNEPDFRRLGDLFTDAWTIAEHQIDFSQYDQSKTAFVIFHAGTGRDVDLKSVLGFDPTPFDLPSVYLGLKNLKEFYGNTYDGYVTNSGFKIQNSMVIPSNELRELDLISGKYLLRLGINGILVATFGSYLGLPDLFNTQTGRTAIGRFGLMDGQSIFSYNGIFPPEPSAWEKVYLGFKEPIVISSGNQLLNIKESSTGNFTDSTIFKVLISSREYFLIENRNRDPYHNGLKIYTRNRSFNDSNVYTQDISGFESFNIDKIRGNVTDVSNPDWSLPGLINDTANFRGGILIWHIDENVIDENISSNSINNNIKRRGVSLEEAKGSQTIGVTFSTPFGDITGDGTIYDYWFKGYHGVPETIYKNEFTPSSIPNSLSYSLANNFIYVTEFDTISPSMNFRVKIGSDIISPLAGFPIRLPVDTTGNSQVIAFDFMNVSGDQIFANSNNNVYGFNLNGSSIGGTAVLIPKAGKFIPSTLRGESVNTLFALSDSELKSYNSNGISNSRILNSGTVSAPSLVIQNRGAVYLGFNTGVINSYDQNLTEVRVDSIQGSVIAFSQNVTDSFSVINGNFKYLVTGNISTATSQDILTTDLNNRLILNGNQIKISYNYSAINSSPVLADLNRDGRQEIIFVADSTIFAINSNGVLVDNFPINFDRNISSGISVADINDDGISELLFVTSDGNLYAYGVNGKILNGFPLLVSSKTISTPAILNADGYFGLAVLGNDGFLYAFRTNHQYKPENVYWKNYLGNESLSNHNYTGNAHSPGFTSKLPESKVYNWPNPVYDGKTYIRYFINGIASDVKIKILDLSGELVTELNGPAFSNSENEILWDAGNVQSGVYYGVITANIDGSEVTRIIKIAVVK
ncbi:MAG: FG-GAP repeat protein [Chlorobi bacterium OLB4]|jgi:hypothetical protein|nr:MAG: FG-GAP repeat protein [Chlorobi bacterium OLB4]MBW7856354.1 hypothetical protein [Ignavibacteria bacterium]OQY78952.1 MAG: hypothetical protein B6D43_01105 [Ignavibacteriales bacterium UTCHB1]